jgi:hypothetical protein
MKAFHCVGVTSRYQAPCGRGDAVSSETCAIAYRDGCDDGGTMPFMRR